MRNTEKNELNNRTYEQTENQICRRVRLSCNNGGRAYRIAITGCHVYEHEEVEIIRCPVIEADTIDIPGWDKEIATPEF